MGFFIFGKFHTGLLYGFLPSAYRCRAGCLLNGEGVRVKVATQPVSYFEDVVVSSLDLRMWSDRGDAPVWAYISRSYQRRVLL
jgi:hypothetical protein